MSFERPREITAHHLTGWAGVQTRQSSERQTKENRWSLEYQRGQARWPRLWGWPEEAIRFYEEPGLSGMAIEHRPEFLRMVEDIKAKRLRAVFCADQSRIARNSIEFFRFLDLCQTHGVLFVVDGRIVSLGGDGGDDVGTKLMAVIDEFDNKKRLGYLRRGILAKVGAGKAVCAPPTGLVSVGKGEWDLDPDPEVQASIPYTFTVLLEERSCARTVRRLKREGRKLPARKPKKALFWVQPTVRNILRIVKNPAYYGAFVFRQRVVDPTRGRDSRGHSRVRVATPEERIVVEDHHPAFVSREVWEEAQAILRNNAPSKNRRNPGPGCALLQGIVTCGLHERSLSVDYRERLRDGRDGSFYYHCHGDYEVGGCQCMVFPGRPLDLAVTRAVFARLTRPSLELIGTELEREKKNQAGASHARRVAVEQARRRVEDLHNRYLVLNPGLRDLAERLEIDLNEAIADHKRLQAELSAQTSTPDTLGADAFAELVELCEDLPGLFYAATTMNRDRKEIVRTMVERVVVQGRTEETVTAMVFWADGAEPTPVEARLARYAHRLIREFAEQGLGNPEIARRLNKMEIRTSRGKTWTIPTVWTARFGKGRYRRPRGESEDRRAIGCTYPI